MRWINACCNFLKNWTLAFKRIVAPLYDLLGNLMKVKISYLVMVVCVFRYILYQRGIYIYISVLNLVKNRKRMFMMPELLCMSWQMAPKQKIRIKLRSYWVPLIEDSCKQILDAAKNTNAKTMGPVPLPTKKRIYCVLKSPHVHKDARFHFEIRTHQRLIDILYPTAQTIDSLMQLDLPAGVDVEVKL